MDGIVYLYGTLIYLPPRTRSVSLKTEFLNLFVYFHKLAKRHISTNQPTNQPYFVFLREFFTFLFLKFLKKDHSGGEWEFLKVLDLRKLLVKGKG